MHGRIGEEDSDRLFVPFGASGALGYADNSLTLRPQFDVGGPSINSGTGQDIAFISNTSSVGTTGVFTNQDINGLLGGTAWASTNITYSFPTSITNYGAFYGDVSALQGFQQLIASQVTVAQYAFGLISQYTQLTFSQITETNSTHAIIRVAGSSKPDTSYAYLPWTDSTAGDIWIGNVRNDAPQKADYVFNTIMHEIGHAVGLKHGHEDDGEHGVLPTEHQSTSWSLMDYHSFVGGSLFYTNDVGSGPQTYMIDDIAALQYMYGANFSTNSGNTVYTFSPTTGEMFINGIGQGAAVTNTIYEALWDGGGTDTYDLSNYTTDLLLDLRPGYWSTFFEQQLAYLDNSDDSVRAPGNLANANEYNNDPRSLIENALGGTGNDLITGNDAANALDGGGGNDTIDGGAAGDALNGGAGDDQLIGNAGDDTLNGGAGNDTLDGGSGVDTASFAGTGAAADLASGTASGAGTDTFVSIENLTGGDGNDTLSGDGNANLLTGGLGDDVLVGRAGNDTLDGSGGVDTADYSAESSSISASMVTQSATGATIGTDTLLNIEILKGGSGSDTLDGGTVARLVGGDGNDSLISSATFVDIDGGNGNDTADLSGINMAMTGNLLQLLGATPGSLTITFHSVENLIGGSGNDTLGGDSGDNLLKGGLGDDAFTYTFGNDTLDGGTGTDTAALATAQAVTANLSTGTATILASTYTLISIENVTTFDGNDSLTGNAGANVLSGGNGNDTIDGRAGNDSLDGGAGTDTASFAAENSAVGASLVTGMAVGAGSGSDTLANFENLTGGAGADTLTGNGGINVIAGGSGNDTIDGGAGDDALDGGSGIDTASFASDGAGVVASLAVGAAGGSSSGSDSLANFENLLGGGGADTLTGNALANLLSGGNGNDTVVGAAGNDILDGGGGTDVASYAAETLSVTASLITNTATGTGSGSDTLTGIETLWGGSGNDSLTGDANANALLGNDGNDTLVAGSGIDTLSGGNGDDTLDFASFFTAADRADGGSGLDTLILNGDYSTLLTFVAATIAGIDTISLKDGFSYQLRTNDANVAAGQTLTIDASHLDTTFSLTFKGNSETDGSLAINGGKGADSLTGGKGNDAIKGNGGDDAIDCSGGGNDTVFGNAGNDIFHFGNAFTAADSVDGGGSGRDTLHLNGDYSAGVVFGATTVVGMGLFKLDGGNSYALTTADATVAAAKTLTVDATKLGAGNVLNFNGSAETDGTLVLWGGDGGDTLIGGAGADTLQGGLGADVLAGGAGADLFKEKHVAESSASTYDTLTDFDFSMDHLDVAKTLKAIDTEIGGAALSQASLDSDLTSLLDAAHLGARHGVLVDTASGTLAGHVFLIVDGNDIAGYQAGADYVFDVTTAGNLGSLDKTDFI